MDYAKESLRLHGEWKGKIEVVATVPVATNMTDEYIVLPEAIVPVVSEMGSAPFVLMGFNLWTAEFKDAACGKIQGVISGDNSAQDAVDTMWSVEQEYYKNK